MEHPYRPRRVGSGERFTFTPREPVLSPDLVIMASAAVVVFIFALGLGLGIAEVLDHAGQALRALP